MPELAPILLDASVLINLLGSGVPGEILSALGGHPVAARQVFNEVKRCPFDGESGRGPLVPLLEGGFLEILELDEKSVELFVSLVSAKPPDDLDDGEAATIAHGVAREAIVVIDERKGRRICREHFPQLETLCSLDLFRFYFDLCGDAERFRKSLSGAIERTNMHVPRSYRQWVSNILGGGIGK